MQTFMPYQSFKRTAKVLDQRRLGKQRVETYQIMGTLLGLRLKTGEVIDTGRTEIIHYEDQTWEEVPVLQRVQWEPKDWVVEEREPGHWRRHPAVLMWAGHESWLMGYQSMICREWTDRGFKDTCYDKTHALYVASGWRVGPKPEWLGNRAFHRSHKSNLLRKDPEHYGPLFPNVPDDLEYVWPSAAA